MDEAHPDDKQAAIRELIQQYYPDAHRISVTLSANGISHHLRWHYTEDLEPQQADVKSERDPSPALSYASTVLVDRDGDSQMGDEEEDRLQTPQRELPYDPGSVVLTPKKDGWRTLRRERRMGGGLDWWHDVPDERLAIHRDRSLPPEYYEHPGNPAQLALRAMNGLDAERARHSPQRDQPPYIDDDAQSVWSVATEATVIINPDDPEEPTLFNNEMPIVREPTWPVVHGDQPGPVAAPAQPARLQGHLSTIQEEGSSSSVVDVQAWTSKLPSFGHVRLFRTKNGDWVREGSFGPDASYRIDRSILPPRVDQVMEDEAPQAGPSSMPSRAGPSRAGPSAEAGPSNGGAMSRTKGKRPARPVPVVLLPTYKQVREAQRNANPTPRRSARLRGKANA